MSAFAAFCLRDLCADAIDFREQRGNGAKVVSRDTIPGREGKNEQSDRT
jgi:hypothetical protein